MIIRLMICVYCEQRRGNQLLFISCFLTCRSYSNNRFQFSLISIQYAIGRTRKIVNKKYKHKHSQSVNHRVADRYYRVQREKKPQLKPVCEFNCLICGKPSKYSSVSFCSLFIFIVRKCDRNSNRVDLQLHWWLIKSSIVKCHRRRSYLCHLQYNVTS